MAMLWWVLFQLKSTDPEKRKTAVAKLCDFPAPRATDVLLGCLTDADDLVRAEAARALGRMQAAEAVGALVRCLESDYESSHVKELAGEALVLIGQPSVGRLVHALRHSKPWVRRRAAKLLGEIKAPGTAEPLAKALDCEGSTLEVWDAAVWALEQLRWQPAQPRHQAIFAVVHRQWEEAVKLGAAAIDPLLQIASERYAAPKESEKAENALAQMADSAVEPLIARLQARSNNLANVATLLGRIGDLRAVDPLLEALHATKDHDGEVRAAVIEALGELGDLRAVEPLIQALKHDAKLWARAAAAKALGKLRDARAVGPLIAALGEKDRGLQFAVMDGVVGRAVLAATLQSGLATEADMLKDYSRLRASAAVALGEIGDARAIGPLRGATKDAALGVQAVAREALRRLQTTV